LYSRDLVSSTFTAGKFYRTKSLGKAFGGLYLKPERGDCNVRWYLEMIKKSFLILIVKFRVR
jgi:hypothetical protein